jgi:hypothetical protein
MWVKWDGDRGLLMRKDDGNGDEGWFLEFRSFDSCLGMTIVHSSANLRRHTNTLPPKGVWFHFAVTWDGTSVREGTRVFINGSEISYNCVNDNGSGSRASDSTRPLMIGEGFNGQIDEVAIWRRILSDAEIKNLYLRGAQQVKFQVQSCSSASCTPEAFVGPDGTSSTYFNAGSFTGVGQPTISLGASVVSSRYFRYRAFIDVMDSALAPTLTRVEPKPVTYSSASPSVTSSSLINYVSLSGFTHTLATANSCATHQLSKDGTNWYHYTAGAWQPASSPAQSNSAAVIQAQAASFGSQVGSGYLFLRSFLNSSGLAPCELDHVQIQGAR